MSNDEVLCPRCGRAVFKNMSFCDNCGANVVSKENTGSPKSRLVALLLAIFLGVYGAHRFYAGKIKSAVVMLFLEPVQNLFNISLIVQK